MTPIGIAALFVGAFLISVVGVRVSISLAGRLGAVDAPDMDRKQQEAPIPRLGGVAVAFALLVATLAVAQLLPTVSGWMALSIVGPAFLVAVVGLVDDTRHLSPWIRMAVQAVAALLAFALGTRIEIFGPTWLNAVVFVLWVMVIINGINLLDNSDGLAASTVAVAGVGAAAISIYAGQELVSLMAISLVGVSVGFLWHNWHPARVYLGDSGAYFLGFIVAVLAVKLRPESAPPTLAALAAVLLLILPIVDTIYVVIKRLSAGIHPFTAGRDHLSHALQERGLSVPASVGVLQLLSVGGSVSAFLLLALTG